MKVRFYPRQLHKFFWTNNSLMNHTLSHFRLCSTRFSKLDQVWYGSICVQSLLDMLLECRINSNFLILINISFDLLKTDKYIIYLTMVFPCFSNLMKNIFLWIFNEYFSSECETIYNLFVNLYDLNFTSMYVDK